MLLVSFFAIQINKQLGCRDVINLHLTKICIPCLNSWKITFEIKNQWSFHSESETTVINNNKPQNHLPRYLENDIINEKICERHIWLTDSNCTMQRRVTPEFETNSFDILNNIRWTFKLVSSHFYVCVRHKYNGRVKYIYILKTFRQLWIRAIRLIFSS